MIHILQKEDCCGCGACAQKCPKHCISMVSDEEGFLYPQIDSTLCIECNLCEKVCPIINQRPAREPLHTYASIYNDESVRKESSSGGMFTCFAEQILKKKGVVFGAIFNEKWEVVHSYIEDVKDLKKLRGSKYVQSFIGKSFIQAEIFLKQGRPVLFCGTPCQIAGLHCFLKKNYTNLYTIDVICHGVPSPQIWQRYLSELKLKSISTINFRNKENGWKAFNFHLNGTKEQNGNVQSLSIQENFRKNIYCSGFMHNLYLRPSCYHCPARSGKSGSLISLADLWGIDRIIPKLDDDKGCSLVILYQESALNFENCTKEEIDLSRAMSSNRCISQSVEYPSKRNTFFKMLKKKGMIPSTIKCTQKPLADVVIYRIKHAIYLFLTKFIKL